MNRELSFPSSFILVSSPLDLLGSPTYNCSFYEESDDWVAVTDPEPGAQATGFSPQLYVGGQQAYLGLEKMEK